ncbi:MAG: response regulator, partial [Phycisphaerales bacterium]|nr:response regulator [Phycisphaerales bacterium]
GEETRPQATVDNAGSQPLQGARVLLVEDGPDNQRLISFVLKKAGAEVVTAENGAIGCDRALEARAAGRPFDVILMDMQMPVMDGYAATRQLRDREYAGPVIALTAHAMVEDRQKCRDAGCDDFATKPINRTGLVQMVARWAHEPHRQPEPAGQAVQLVSRDRG